MTTENELKKEPILDKLIEFRDRFMNSCWACDYPNSEFIHSLETKQHWDESETKKFLVELLEQKNDK